ncbi:LysM peptidoglycan-binding domain-containing protein [Roseibium sp. CAU 1637]|uniref:LysM peptidoglycan-binding domain-containing protein n=1 Tax=Roseibium limicola TaxID=2816037 RepID=A0A939ENQ7_9HYPH|nr:LysM peptidoglycan-binding domain-containing protein [Roseibium limicola]MBO0346120.1 LysM peptidoglycan-binding domain-containing protein [Roseibium limicola]
MTKLALIRTIIVAILVGAGALVTGYIYSNSPDEGEPAVAEAPASPAETSNGSSDVASVAADAVDAEVEDAAVADDGPSFDVVGVEPTGDTVVAGRSDPGAIVALVANGKVVGRGQANTKGEWTIILDDPLTAGQYDVGLETQDKDGNKTGESKQRLAVSISEDGKEQPLVVLNAPDAPSTILQVPEAQPAAETVVAAANQTAVPNEDPSDKAADAEALAEGVTADAADAAETVADAIADAVDQPAETDLSKMAALSPPAEDADNAAGQAPNAAQSGDVGEPETEAETPTQASPPSSVEQETAVDATASEGDDSSATADVATADGSGTNGEATADVAVDTNTETGSDATQLTAVAPQAEPDTDMAPVEAGDMVVTVEAVEAENGKVYVAGTGEAGHVVRVYVADKSLGEATMKGGDRWLVQGAVNLEAGAVEVRADMLDAKTGVVVARAAVTFEKAAEKAIVLTRVVTEGAADSQGGQVNANVERALPNVIIRKGDNLWNIARRLYGTGYRYTTIYQANQTQIRNPDLIYPGQVFLTPEGDLSWPTN